MRYHRLGNVPRKHHIQFRKPDGGLYAEELFSTIGFSGPMATMYHINLPTEVSGWEDRGSIKIEYLEDEPLRHRHLRTKLMKPCGDAVSGRVALLGDASHAMLPYLAQGAAMALEDAEQLGISLQIKEHDVPAAWQHFANARWQRNAQVQEKSRRNGVIFHAKGPLRWVRNIAMKWGGEGLLDSPWLYGGEGA